MLFYCKSYIFFLQIVGYEFEEYNVQVTNIGTNHSNAIVKGHSIHFSLESCNVAEGCIC